MTPIASASDHRIIRVAPSTIIIFSILCLPLLLMGAITLWKSDRQLLEGVLLCASYPLAIYAICSPKVILESGTLRYQTFTGDRTINLSSISKVAITARPAPTLELSSDENGQSFAFRIKIFSRSGVACILQHVRTFAPYARFDATSGDLLRADFKSVTREAIKATMVRRLVEGLTGALVTGAIARALIHWHVDLK